MRILHVIPTLDLRAGGPPVALAGLASAQAAAGLDVSIFATFRAQDESSAAQKLRDAGIGVEMIGPTQGPLMRHPTLARSMTQAVSQAEVVHIHTLWEEPQHQAAVAARRAGIPYLITPHGMLDPWSLAQKRLKKRLYLAWRLRRNLDRAAAVHFTTEIERDLVAPMGLKARPLVEPNGLDLGEFAHLPAPGSFRSKFPQLAGRFVVLFMSRLHYKKGLDLLIPAFAQIRNRQAMLVIAGPDSDSYQAVVQQMIDRERLGERVLFTGMLWNADRVAALADADLFVLSSYQENFGIVVIEALAAGTPVVISDQVNIHREVASAGVGGVVPLDAARLTAELDRWLDTPELREAASVKARAFARSHYDWRQIALNWKKHYAQIIGAS